MARSTLEPRRTGARWQLAGASSPGSMEEAANGVWHELAERGATPCAGVAGAQASREASVVLSDVEDRRDSDSDFAVDSDGGADDPRADADNSAADSLGSSGYGASYGCGCACRAAAECTALQQMRPRHLCIFQTQQGFCLQDSAQAVQHSAKHACSKAGAEAAAAPRTGNGGATARTKRASTHGWTPATTTCCVSCARWRPTASTRAARRPAARRTAATPPAAGGPQVRAGSRVADWCLRVLSCAHRLSFAAGKWHVTCKPTASCLGAVLERDCTTEQEAAERAALRGAWELASVLEFLEVFHAQLGLPRRCSAADLEAALVRSPGGPGVLADVHLVRAQHISSWRLFEGLAVLPERSRVCDGLPCLSSFLYVLCAVTRVRGGHCIRLAVDAPSPFLIRQ